MRIRTQFVIMMLLFGSTLAVIAASALVTNRLAEQAVEQEQLAGQIAQGASKLAYLSNDYLMYRESQQLHRWQTTSAAFAGQVSSLNVTGSEQQALARSLRTGEARMREVFDSITAGIGDSTDGGSTDMAQLQVAWSRMAVQSQGLISDANRLASLLNDEIDRLAAIRTWLTYGMLGLFGAYFLINYLTTQRRILKSIDTLRAGTEVVGSGNLDYAIPVERNDEISELGRAFNLMAASLKSVTASRAELETEVAERRRVEGEVVRLNRSLARRAAELEAANQDLEAFTYSVSHDLRAPLRGVDGFSQALQEDCAAQLDAEGQQYLGMVRQNAQRMGHLIDDLLAFSRLGRQAVQVRAIQPDEIARRAWEELQPEWADRPVELRLGALPTCEADPALLKQVYLNLLSNALKFSRSRAPALIEVGCERREGGACVFYVKDNGTGFDMQYHDRLFGVFQRLHRPEEYEGTGVGLAIVQRIIQRHGGRVWAEGEVDRGATFYFTLGGNGRE